MQPLRRGTVYIGNNVEIDEKNKRKLLEKKQKTTKMYQQKMLYAHSSL